MTVKNQNGSITQSPVNELVFVSGASAVAKTVARLIGGKQTFAVTDENVARLHPEILPRNNVYVLSPGEDAKTLASVENICRAMLAAGMTRGSVVAAYGGGVVGDLAGFAASVYMRGVSFINVPTTLLSQVDSAIGGKTGANLDGYKNMIGSFHMPTHIVICPDLLGTLPPREWRCGLGELFKTALLDAELYDYCTRYGREIAARDPLKTERAVAMAADFKKKITDDDPEERGKRMILNLGHTVGHALETCDNHKLSHGEYVLLGMKIENAMTRLTPFADEAEKLLAVAGLPPLPAVAAEDVTAAAKKDKKNNSGKIRLIGLVAAGKQAICEYSQAEFAERYERATAAWEQKGEGTRV